MEDTSEKHQHTYNALCQMLSMAENPLSLAIKMFHFKIRVSRTHLKEASVVVRKGIPKPATRNYKLSNSNLLQ